MVKEKVVALNVCRVLAIAQKLQTFVQYNQCKLVVLVNVVVLKCFLYFFKLLLRYPLFKQCMLYVIKEDVRSLYLVVIDVFCNYRSNPFLDRTLSLVTTTFYLLPLLLVIK